MRYLLLIILVLTSCSVNKNLTTIKYGLETHSKFYMDVPKGYDYKAMEVTVEKEQRYIYTDSSFIYISSFKYTPNSENIENLGDSIYQYRFQNKELTKETNKLVGKDVIKLLPNIFELSGKDGNSLFWKDIYMEEVSIGYKNVPKEKKEVFDNYLRTFRKK